MLKNPEKSRGHLFKNGHFYTSEDLKPHPIGGAMVQTITGNLVEVSSAMRIEIFNGVKCPIFKTYHGLFTKKFILL
jgi:hypothetical protein